MTKIAVYGSFGGGNIGDEACWQSIVDNDYSLNVQTELYDIYKEFIYGN